MDYSDKFLEGLHYLATTYRKFPKFMIEIIAENYGIPSSKIKELIYKFRKEGVLVIVKNEGYTFILENK